MDKTLLNDDCIENVITYYSDMVYRLAFARTGTKDDAEDIFQEVFLRYVRKKPIFRGEEHRKAWLIRVTINCSNNFWNSMWKKRVQELTSEILEANIFETKEEINLFKELHKLPNKYREVIHLFYYEDMSLEEISRVLKRKNSTVRAQLTRARNKLRTFMEEEDYV